MANLTEKALAQSLCQLLEKMPLDKITVRDITDGCGMTRNTFYYHFHDVYELLDRIFTSETENLIEHYKTEEDWSGGFLEGLKFLHDRRRMIDHIYRFMDREQLDRYLNEMVYRHALTVIGREFRNTDYPRRVLELSAQFYKNAIVGAVIDWIERGMVYDPEKLATLYNEVFLGTIQPVFASVDRAMKKAE